MMRFNGGLKLVLVGFMAFSMGSAGAILSHMGNTEEVVTPAVLGDMVVAGTVSSEVPEITTQKPAPKSLFTRLANSVVQTAVVITESAAEAADNLASTFIITEPIIDSPPEDPAPVEEEVVEEEVTEEEQPVITEPIVDSPPEEPAPVVEEPIQESPAEEAPIVEEPIQESPAEEPVEIPAEEEVPSETELA